MSFVDNRKFLKRIAKENEEAMTWIPTTCKELQEATP